MLSGNSQKTRILLVYPPVDPIGVGGRFNVVDVYQPLGLAYIAAVLEKAGYEVRIIDAKVEPLSVEQIIKKTADFNPQIVGFSFSTLDFHITKRLAQGLKSCGNYTVIIGGPHVSALPEETMQEECFDYGVIGEGERTTIELVDALCQGRKEAIPAIRGIAFRDGLRVIRTPEQAYIEDLDSIPFPARHLLPDVKRYRYSWYKYLPTATIITSRGCPYQCTFCDRAVFGNKLRMRSVENIIDEIEMLVKEYGVRGVNILDVLFTISSERIEAFCQQLISRKLRVSR